MVLTSLPEFDTAMFKSKIEVFTPNPLICKWLPQLRLQACLLHAKEKASLTTKNKVRKVAEKKYITV
jgi:hypothetical protein